MGWERLPIPRLLSGISSGLCLLISKHGGRDIIKELLRRVNEIWFLVSTGNMTNIGLFFLPRRSNTVPCTTAPVSKQAPRLTCVVSIFICICSFSLKIVSRMRAEAVSVFSESLHVSVRHLTPRRCLTYGNYIHIKSCHLFSYVGPQESTDTLETLRSGMEPMHE